MKKEKTDDTMSNLATKKEIENLKFYFERKYNLPFTIFQDNEDFYKTILELLPNKVNIQNDINLIDCLNKAGYNLDNVLVTIYLICNITNKVIKIDAKDLIEKWEDIWCPPEDDALLIHIPSKGTFLFTHWDILYFDILIEYS